MLTDPKAALVNRRDANAASGLTFVVRRPRVDSRRGPGCAVCGEKFMPVAGRWPRRGWPQMRSEAPEDLYGRQVDPVLIQ